METKNINVTYADDVHSDLDDHKRKLSVELNKNLSWADFFLELHRRVFHEGK